MQKRIDKDQTSQSQSFASEVTDKRTQQLQASQITDNRPEAIQMRKLQEAANQHLALNTVDFIDNRPSNNLLQNQVIQKISDKEDELITNWIRMFASIYLTDVSPNMITDAEPSKAVRLRWFGLKIGDYRYNVGVNIHYGGKNIGGVWLKNQTTGEAKEFHPYRKPMHNFGTELLANLKYHVREKKRSLYKKVKSSRD